MTVLRLAGALVGVLLLGACGSVPPPPVPHPRPAPASLSPRPPAGVGRLGAAPALGLTTPAEKQIAMELVSSAENSGLDWRSYYRYVEDINDGRGYTAGIIGFCSGTGDMLILVRHYTAVEPHNVLAKYLPALTALVGSDAHTGLDPGFESDWVTAAADPVFQRSQNYERDAMYFDPAMAAARKDGIGTLGQFMYYDAIVMHGADGLARIRRLAKGRAKTPTQGGDERTYLSAFLDARVAVMKSEPDHHNTTRVDTEQRVFLNEGNLALTPPLTWKVYNTPFHIPAL